MKKKTRIATTKDNDFLNKTLPIKADVTIKWPELGNKGVVIGDIKLPEDVLTDDSADLRMSATKIITGGLFIEMGEQQIWPIRYRSDSVNVTPFLPGIFSASRKLMR